MFKRLEKNTAKKYISYLFIAVIAGFIFFGNHVLFKENNSKESQTKTKNAIIINRLEFNRDPENYNVNLQIIDQNTVKIADFKVAVANTNKKRTQGLMNLDHLPQEHGMIFTFNKSQVIAMWMKNTLIPLDMIFIDENDRIVNIAQNTTPHSLDIISSKEKITKVLEVNAGLVETLGIKIGHHIQAPELATYEYNEDEKIYN